MFRYSGYFVAACLCLPAPVAAQDQTPEGAREFLRIVLNNGKTTYRSRFRFAHLAQTEVADQAIASAAWTGACELVLTTVSDGKTTDTPYNFSAENEFLVREGRGEVASYYGTPPQGFAFFEGSFAVGSDDLAVRFAYAANFLRDACDPTVGTGF